MAGKAKTYQAWKAEALSEQPDNNLVTDLLGQTLRAEFDDVAAERYEYEDLWLRDYRQYKGLYDPEVLQQIARDKSHTNILLTRVKVRTMDARLLDMLFPAGGDKNWAIEPTPIPEVAEAEKQDLRQQVMAEVGEDPSDEELEAMVKDLAETRAERMAEEIDDQLTEEHRYQQTCADVLHNGHVYGTGILKGPMTDRKERKRWTRIQAGDGAELHTLDAQEQRVPYFESVSTWDFYPDMSAIRLEDADFVFQRHIMPRHKVRKLAHKRGFDKDKINEYLRTFPQGDAEYLHWETELRNINGNMDTVSAERKKKYIVLERWGAMTGQELSDCGCEVPEDMLEEEIEAHVWLLGDQVIKAVLNPTEQQSWPYQLYFFERDETSIFGLSVPSSIRDPASNYNAMNRAALDNAGITAGPQVEINLDLLDPSETEPQIFGPFRLWFRRGTGEEAKYPAVRVMDVSSKINEIIKLAEYQKQLVDETSLIPSYMHGNADKGGAGNTATGLSMLMGAANIMLKEAVRNYDNGITKPFIEAMYHWNMQFNEKEHIKGDFAVKATGSSSLVAKEVRAQQLTAFSESVKNPMDAPWIKWPELIKQRAAALDVGEDVVKTREEVEAEQQQAMAAQQDQQQAGAPMEAA